MGLAKKWPVATIGGLQGTQNDQKGLKMTHVTLQQKLMKNNEIFSSKP